MKMSKVNYKFQHGEITKICCKERVSHRKMKTMLFI